LDPDPRPKFSVKEHKRVELSRFYAISQIEYARCRPGQRDYRVGAIGCGEGADSRDSGLWVGGMVPLGYVSRDKKLVIEEGRGRLTGLVVPWLVHRHA
jgi:hypothetical protein